MLLVLLLQLVTASCEGYDLPKTVVQGTECRLEPADVTCHPGAELQIDVGTRGRDLCILGATRKAHTPFCAGRGAQKYVQQLIYRALLPVERSGAPIRREWVEVEQHRVGREEQLVTRKPVAQDGPDGCLYPRVPRWVFARPAPSR